jgi:hypothetical protein
MNVNPTGLSILKHFSSAQNGSLTFLCNSSAKSMHADFCGQCMFMSGEHMPFEAGGSAIQARELEHANGRCCESVSSQGMA